MPLPTWLPPLHTNHDYSVHVTAVQCPPPPPSCSSPCSGFLINFNVTITYLCEDPMVSTAQLKSLSLSQAFHLPPDHIDISTPSSLLSTRKLISHLFNLMPVPFSLDRFYWRSSRLDGFKSTNILVNENNAESCILKYLIETRESSSQCQSQMFAIELTINKEVHLPKEEFETLIHWYDRQKRLNPSFEDDYAEAISIPWSSNAEFYEALSVRCVCPSVDKLMRGVAYKGGDAEEMCSICLEGFVVGSRVTRLPCHHMYHGGCIMEWLTEKNSCPLCRHDLFLYFYLGW